MDKATETPTDVWAKITTVNQYLQKCEPDSVTRDPSTDYIGYKPQYVIDGMNEVFGLGNWGFEEIQSEVISDATKGPSLVITQTRAWLKDVDFKPVAWGQSRVTRGDVGDAKKGAQTDGIKKALSYFSIGNRAYMGLLVDKQAAKAATPAPTATKVQSYTTAPAPAPVENPAMNSFTEGINGAESTEELDAIRDVIKTTAEIKWPEKYKLFALLEQKKKTLASPPPPVQPSPEEQVPLPEEP